MTPKTRTATKPTGQPKAAAAEAPADECNAPDCPRTPTHRGLCDAHWQTHRGLADPKKKDAPDE